MKLKIKRLDKDAKLPQYAHKGDAGLDISSLEKATIKPGKSKLIRTGLLIQLPKGTEAQIRPRSGLALNHQVTVLNSPGTIDNGHRGELCVILINHGSKSYTVLPGARIAQLVVSRVYTVEVSETGKLDFSDRGSKGFGSTGIR